MPAVDDIEDEETHQIRSTSLKKPSRSHRGKSEEKKKGKKEDKEEQPEDIDLCDDKDEGIEKKGRRLALSGSNSSIEGLSKGIPSSSSKLSLSPFPSPPSPLLLFSQFFLITRSR